MFPLKGWSNTAAAKSLQLCPTLCNPRDSSPPGSPIPGILQARTLEWAQDINGRISGKYNSIHKGPQFSSVQLLSPVQLFVTPWNAARQASLSITNSQSLLKLMSIESVMPSNHLILCRPLFPLPSIFSSIRVFSNESALCIRWPKFWSFLRVGLRLQG